MRYICERGADKRPANPAKEAMNMKKLIFSMIAIIICLALVGCVSKVRPGELLSPTAAPGIADNTQPPADHREDPDDGEAKTTPEPDLNEGGAGQPLFHDVIRAGGGSTAVGTSYRVFSDYEQFRNALGDREDLASRYNTRSFGDMFVVAVYITVNHGGYSFDLNSAGIMLGKVNVDVKMNAPAPDAITTQAFETHCVLVAFDSAEFSPDLVYNITVNGAQFSSGFDSI